MAVYVDACQNGTEWRFRLWDSQTGTYLTEELAIGGILVSIKGLLADGGILESPDATAAVFDWLAVATDRGTNDASKKSVDAPSRSWRSSGDREPVPGPLRTALRARALSEQAARSIFDLRIAEWTARLTPGARAFLDRTVILAELLRDKGTGTHHVRPGSPDAEFVEEIAREWADVVTVERTDASDSARTTHIFRLR